jgi:uncharacterized protein (TIGR02453 family)
MVQKSTLEFLEELKENNHKPWFDENRKRYETVKADYISAAGHILAIMKKHDESLDILDAKDCTFRINKDIRFSKDKSPYKTHLGIALHPYGKKMQLAAYYIHIEKDQAFLGGGLWHPDASALKKVRKEIDFFHDEFFKIIQAPSFKKIYGDLDIEEGQKTTRPPKGYEADHPAIEYLKLKSFTTTVKLSNKQLTDPKAWEQVTEILKALTPLVAFINRGLMSDDEGGL